MKTDRESISLLKEVFLLWLLCAVIGFLWNPSLVRDGFNGQLSRRIKQHLASRLTEKVQGTKGVDRGATIVMIETAQAKRMWDEQEALFVDARPEARFVDGHIPGAVNVTEDTVDDSIYFFSDQVEQGGIVLYCSGPECPEAVDMAALLVSRGVAPVFVYRGGWEEWVQCRYPVLGAEDT